MAKTNMLIGCKLPHGIALEHPIDKTKKVTLNGLNKIRIIGAGYAITEVPEDFWFAWLGFHSDFPALKSGAIFVAKNAEDLEAKAKELVKEETGFEPMKKNGKDKRAGGVKTVSDKDD